MSYVMEHISGFLFGLAVFLTLVEAWMKWAAPSYRKDPANAKLVETIDSVWVAIVVAISFKAVFVENFTIPSGSMEKTLLVGDYVLVKKWEYGYSFFNKTSRFLVFGKPHRGDIVVFQGVADPSKDLIKRCIGVPGDVIELKDKDVYLNDVKQEEPYTQHVDPYVHPRNYPFDGQILSGSRDNFGPVTVGEGHYFMMGDNRDDSFDSRYWGTLDEKLIKGKAWCIYWHSVRFGTFLLLAGSVAAAFPLLLILAGLGAKFSAARKPRVEGAKAEPPAPSDEGILRMAFIIGVAVALIGIRIAGWDGCKEDMALAKSRIFQSIK